MTLQKLQGTARHHRDSGHGRTVAEDKLAVARARKIQRFLSQPFHVAEMFTGSPGKYVSLKDTIRGFNMIVNGEWRHLPEQAFYMVGTIEDTAIRGHDLDEAKANEAKQRAEESLRNKDPAIDYAAAQAELPPSRAGSHPQNCAASRPAFKYGSKRRLRSPFSFGDPVQRLADTSLDGT